jgi:VWFA-related protein
MRVLLAVAVAVALAFGQEAPAPLFRTDSNLVPIEVQVLDGQTGQPIAGLTRDDFIVFDESKMTEVVAFDDGSGPRDIALLLDVSGGFTNEGVNFCAMALLGLQRQEDRVALLSFSDRAARRRTSLTKDKEEIKRALDQIFAVDRNNDRRSVKNSRLLDAIGSAADTLSETTAPRRPLVVVVTHNRERNSTVRQPVLVDSLLTRSIRVEAITIPQEWVSSGLRFGGSVNPALGIPGRRSSPRTPPDPKFLENLRSVEPVTSATGGKVIHLDYVNARRVPAGQSTGRTWDVATVAAIIERDVLARFRDEYGLAIRGASSPKPQFRRLTIKLSPEAEQRHPGAVIYARSGYYTAQSDDSRSAETTNK